MEGLAAADDRVGALGGGGGGAGRAGGRCRARQRRISRRPGAPVREAAAGDLPTAVRRVAAIVLPFNPFQDPANPARAIRAAGDPVLEDRRQILLDPESRDRIGPVSANRVMDRVIDQATAIGLVTDQGTVPETATGRATGRVMVIDPATSRAVMIGPATSRAMATALGIDPATDRAFTRRLTATDRVTGRAIVPITDTDRAPASPAIPTIRAGVRRTGTDIGSRSITVGITAPGMGIGITAALIGTRIRRALGA